MSEKYPWIKMQRLRNLLSEDNEEFCSSLCKKGDEISIRNIGKGEKICVSMTHPKCNEGESPVGIFHANYWGNNITFSKYDIEIAKQYGIICGANKEGLRCFTRRDEIKDDLKAEDMSPVEMSPIQFEETKLEKQYDILKREYLNFEKINIYKNR
jgi:hypothetical protein